MKDLATKVRPLNSRFKQSGRSKHTADKAVIFTTLLLELFQPPVLVFPDWDGVEDNRPIRLCLDICIDGVGGP